MAVNGSRDLLTWPRKENFVSIIRLDLSVISMIEK